MARSTENQILVVWNVIVCMEEFYELFSAVCEVEMISCKYITSMLLLCSFCHCSKNGDLQADKDSLEDFDQYGFFLCFLNIGDQSEYLDF